MKNLLYFFAIACVFLLSSCSKEKLEDEMKFSEVPTLVKTAFDSEFPSARNVRWRPSDKDFEAVYQKNGREKSILYDVNGKLQSEELEMSQREIPLAIKQYLSSIYVGSSVKRAKREKTEEGTFYEVTLIIDEKEVVFDFDADGKLLNEGLEAEEAVLENE